MNGVNEREAFAQVIFLTRVARSARSASEIPFKPILDQGLEVVGGYLLHVDKL